MISAEQLVGEELAEWYSLTPQERWRESAKLWEVFLSLGGSLDPEPDTQSPFFDPGAQCSRPFNGRTGLRLIRRGGVSRDTDFAILASEANSPDCARRWLNFKLK